ncbi:Hypothetical protein FKW44_005065 [Caligus rogercresseyi]|uniref:Uncharacterized protein n=1 Tax=Caligus rogercresseyi TaxID=217165 RepID=A0A7T8KBG3_CALRO|nr:Hypothetical protein FKW44_005065 [Caligus rogercresseyi]
MAGVADRDIFQELLEIRETARNVATGALATAAISSFKKQLPKKTDKCPGCSKTFNLFTEGKYGWNKIPHKECLDCWKTKKMGRDAKRYDMPKEKLSEAGAIEFDIGSMGLQPRAGQAKGHLRYNGWDNLGVRKQN